uniref:NADH-ubiquinone oxidoreductase chain 2 n=1 Tax=Sycobia sp. 2 JXW-2020 TaxID=2781669 RepID=A0A8A6UQN4_9HYME|nr:NADH dehydrogenase subunit 2 [Sycobia sp. 2 JXW-2020]
MIIYYSFYYYLLFLPLYLFSLMLILMTNSWFSMWVVMEMNLIFYIPLLIFDKLCKAQNSMTYFLIQALNSYIFLGTMMMMVMSNINEFLFILILILNFKLGMPPFLNWYLKLMMNMNWLNNFYLSVFQKIIPLLIMSYLLNLNFQIDMKPFILIIMLSSLIYVVMLGYNLSSLKLIFTISSIVHMTWMLSLLLFNEIMFYRYFIIYLIISWMIMSLFHSMNISSLNSLMMIYPSLKYYIMMLMIFNLIGLPVFSGFMMKLFAVMEMLNYSKLLTYILIMYSLLTMNIYFKLIYSSSLMVNLTSKSFLFLNNYNINKLNLSLSWASLFMYQMFNMLN